MYPKLPGFVILRRFLLGPNKNSYDCDNCTTDLCSTVNNSFAVTYQSSTIEKWVNRKIIEISTVKFRTEESWESSPFQSF